MDNFKNTKLRRDDLLYPELSYKIIGASFRVFNELGWGHKEEYYGRALAEELLTQKINFIREKRISLTYNSKVIGKYVLDFIVDRKIIVELKIVSRLGYTHIGQVREYLKAADANLAILIYPPSQKATAVRPWMNATRWYSPIR